MTSQKNYVLELGTYIGNDRKKSPKGTNQVLQKVSTPQTMELRFETTQVQFPKHPKLYEGLGFRV